VGSSLNGKEKGPETLTRRKSLQNTAGGKKGVTALSLEEEIPCPRSEGGVEEIKKRGEDERQRGQEKVNQLYGKKHNLQYSVATSSLRAGAPRRKNALPCGRLVTLAT